MQNCIDTTSNGFSSFDGGTTSVREFYPENWRRSVSVKLMRRQLEDSFGLPGRRQVV